MGVRVLKFTLFAFVALASSVQGGRLREQPVTAAEAKAAFAIGDERLIAWDLDLKGEGSGLLGGAEKPIHEAGYFKLNRTEEAEMFYFFFENRLKDPEAPVVLWMTGGPGCSSELAVFVENGPYHIKDDLTLTDSKFGWDTVSNLIYVDQPINTGFSYSNDPRDDVHTENGVAYDMVDFLQEFMAKHPDMAKRDFYVTGESYAGHYVPAVSHAVWNATRLHQIAPINIRGFAIGNGLTQPSIQYGAYADFSYGNQLISKSLAEKVNAEQYPECKSKIEECSGRSPDDCLNALDVCQNIVGEILEAAGNINVYDIRKQCTFQPLCYDFSNVEKYLNLPSTRKSLGVGDRKWQSCSDSVHKDMMADWMTSLEPLIPPMLEDGIRVLIYAGDQDFICNYLGNKRWVHAMPWSGQGAFDASQDADFNVDGAAAGLVKEAGPLSFLQLYQAGHMVPMDQPRAAQEMLYRFINGQPFGPGAN